MKYYVTMTDKFMSGWGVAEGKTNKFVVECNSYEDAQTIERNAKQRDELKYVNICVNKPTYNKSRFVVSLRKFEDLGEIWTK